MPFHKRVRILVNPSARSGRGPRRLAPLRALRPADTAVEWIDSRCPQHLRDLVQQAQEDHGAELHALGLAGGDGTVALALSALPGPNRVPLGLLPVGSGNDFAKDIGVPSALAAAFDLLLSGTPRWVDVAQAGGARYCCVASVGLDEIALRIIHGSVLPRSKGLNIYAALRALLVYRPRPVRLRWEGGSFEGEVMFAAVTNTRSYGGGFLVSPAARVDDGALDLCVVRRTRRTRLLRSFPRILRGTHGELPEVIQARSPWVDIEGLGGPVPLSLDGELPDGTTPVRLRCQPGALQVLAPARRDAWTTT